MQSFACHIDGLNNKSDKSIRGRLTVKALFILCGTCLMALSGAVFAQQPASEPMTPEAILENLRTAQYDPLEALVDSRYQRFLKNEVGEDAVLEALYPFAELNVTELPRLDDWVKARPDSGIALLVHAYAYEGKGWAARGTKYSSETSRAQFDEMDRRFQRASRSYGAANAKLERCNFCYAGLINIATGQGRKEDIRQLFKEAVAKDPQADYPAYEYFRSLEPKWGGAPGEQDAFVEQFMRVHPANPANKRIRANRLLEQARQVHKGGDKDQAIALYDASLAEYETTEAYLEKGALLAELRREPQASAAYSKAVENWRHIRGAYDYEQRAWAYLHLKRYEDAAADLRKAVNLGSEWAFETLYRQYAGNSGYNVKAQPEKAFELCNQAVLVGIPSAYWALGGMYYFGRGTARAPEKAAVWFERASANGVAGAKTDLGIVLWQGEGVARNQARAIALWREAAQLGDPRGETKLRTHLSSWEYFWQVTVNRWEEKFKQQRRIFAEVLHTLLSLVVLGV